MRLVQRGIALLCSVLLLSILALVLFEYGSTEYWLKRTYLLSQPAMLAAGALGIAALCALGMCAGKAGKRRTPRWLGLLAWAALLMVQLVLCFHAYFITGWDVRGIVETAYAVAGGEADLHIGYLSQYPNNVSLVMVFAAIIRAVRLLLGNPGLDRCIYVLIAFQCGINTFTGMLLYHGARRLTGSTRLSWCAAVIYALFIGLSPWLMIPYSDSTALVFPTAIFALYQFRDEKRFGKWVWPCMGALAGLGYMIKPQVIIAAIAVTMVETIRWAAAKKLMQGLRRAGSMAAVVVLLATAGMQLLIEASPIELRPGRSMNMLHYVMMGLNGETNGSYLYEDVVLTYHAEDKHAQQTPVIRQRLEDMGAKGLAEHLKKKTLTNYADGTFAWSCEGEFFRAWIDDKDEHLSPFLKSIIYTGGSRYNQYQTMAQCVWLALLAGCVLFGLGMLIRDEERMDEACVLMLCIIGITLFQTIFEARARYLYIYAPFYVLLGVCGIWKAVGFGLGRLGLRIRE